MGGDFKLLKNNLLVFGGERKHPHAIVTLKVPSEGIMVFLLIYSNTAPHPMDTRRLMLYPSFQS